MTFSPPISRTSSNGFSLIEVILSLALVASAMVTLMALVPVGLKSSRDATNSIVIGHILEDAHERLEGHPLRDGVLTSEPFFYDDEGVYIAPAQSGPSSEGGDRKTKPEEKKENTRELQRIYRVDIRLVSPSNESIRENAPDLKAVILHIAWPIDPLTGEIPGDPKSVNSKSITYYVNALTGPGWSSVDPDFKALIEF